MQNKRNLILILIAVCFTLQMSVKAMIILDLGIIHNKALNVGEKHILVSEVHEIMKLENGEKFLISMKNGVGVEFKVFFVQNLSDYGPSPLVALTGNIYNSQGNVLKSINQNDFTIKLNTQKKLVFNDQNGQEVLITIKPSLN